MAMKKIVVGLGAAMALSASPGLAATCSGDWMLATENGSVYKGSALHQGNKIVFLGEHQNSAASLHLSGSVAGDQTQVIFRNVENKDQSFSAEIGEGCNVIRGFTESGDRKVFFTMTKVPPVVTAAPAQTMSPQDGTAEPVAGVEQTIATPVVTARAPQAAPAEEKRGFFKRLFSSDDDGEKKEKKRVLIHRDRLGKGF